MLARICRDQKLYLVTAVRLRLARRLRNAELHARHIKIGKYFTHAHSGFRCRTAAHTCQLCPQLSYTAVCLFYERFKLVRARLGVVKALESCRRIVSESLHCTLCCAVFALKAANCIKPSLDLVKHNSRITVKIVGV